MGLLAEFSRLAIASWSPGGSGAGYIACASYAGQIDSSFSSSAQLEILSVDLHRSRLAPTAQLSTSDNFSSLHWGNPARAHPAGLIGGGLADGTVSVWDAASLLRPCKSADEKSALVFSSATTDPSNCHSGSVCAIAFNPFIHSLLASGAQDGQVLIWDLSNPSSAVVPRQPTTKAPSMSSARNDPVTALAWNRKVHNILATATSTGVMNVWDLKQNRQVISIRNPRGRLPCSSLAWHPDVATQIIMTSDDDNTCGVLLWDLRNATSPVTSFSHHAPHGVASAGWSTHDTDLILSSSKDCRTVVFSVSTGEIVVDAPQTADWNFDVKWSPRVPGLYLASSFHGRLSVNSLLTVSSTPSVSSETANALAESFGAMADDFQSGVATQSPRTTDTQRVIYSVARPPQWMCRPCVVSFAFGGAIAFCTKGCSSVTVDTLQDDIPSVSESTASLDSMLLDMTSDDPKGAANWCKEQSELSTTRMDTVAWDILSILFEADSRRKLLAYLGFPPQNKDVADEIAEPVYGLLRSQPISVPVRPSAVNVDCSSLANTAISEEKSISNGATLSGLDGPAPWDVSGPGRDINVKGSLLDGDDANGNQLNDSSGGKDTTDECEGNGQDFSSKSSEEIDDIIKRAVIVADFRAAVDACLYQGRTADALVIAHAGGPDLWFHTQAEYLSKACLSSGSMIVSAVVGPKSKLEDYIRHGAEAEGDIWKEALAMVLTYCNAEEFSESCTSLGNRLLEKNNRIGALVCFLCASNTRMVATTWFQTQTDKAASTILMLKSRYDRLNYMVQKVRIFTAAVLLARGEREIGVVRELDDVSGSILCEYGALLALHGDYSLAVTYLSNLDGSNNCLFGTAESLHVAAAAHLTSADTRELASPHFNPLHYTRSTSLDARVQEPLNGFNREPPPPKAPSNLGYGQPTYPEGARVVSPHLPSSVSAASPAKTPIPPVAIPDVSQLVPPTPGTYRIPTVSELNPGDAGLQRPPLPSVPTVHQSDALPKDAANSPAHVTSGVAPPPPPMPLTSQYRSESVVAGGSGTATDPTNLMYGMKAAPLVLGGQSLGSSQGVLPPPPPPVGGEGHLPSSYHARARQGSGATLPPSAEVAVSETRRAKATSSSGTPGMSRRTASASSSLSGLASDNVPLDKTDFSKLGAKEAMIVKSLQKALSHARTLNQAGMYRRKMEDINKRLGRLAAGLSAGVVEMEVIDLLSTVVGGIEKGDRALASATVTTISKQFWESSRLWFQGLKWLLDCVLPGR